MQRHRFQSTRPRGARQRIRLSWSMLAAMFQSTRRARHQGRVHGLVHCPVSIHAPAWARPIGRHRVGVDDPVSIHAPAWARRRRGAADGAVVDVSIHAPAWARRSGRPSAACTRCFNPRARVGATQGNGKTLNTIKVSIHAPAWARRAEFRITEAADLFQSTRPRARRLASSRATPAKCFNPRARVGRDSRRWQRLCETASFNPRARVGRDRVTRNCIATSPCFNPRARVGATAPARVLPHGVWEFQSTPAGRDSVEWGWLRKRLFQSTRPRARPVSHFVSATSSVFQSTRPRGRDHFIAIRRFMS